jgi:hypothetical protein
MFCIVTSLTAIAILCRSAADTPMNETKSEANKAVANNDVHWQNDNVLECASH